MCVEINSLQGQLKRCQRTKILKQVSRKLREFGIQTLNLDRQIEPTNPHLEESGKHLANLTATYTVPITGKKIVVTDIIVDKNANVLQIGSNFLGGNLTL